MTFVGGTEDQNIFNKLQSLINNSDFLKGNVFFTGFTKNVNQFLDKAHIMLFPSQGEGLSNSMIEAFFHKVLPITYNNTVFPEFLKLGFVFPQAKHNDLNELYKLTKEVTEWSPKEFQEKTNHNYRLAQKYFSNSEILSQYSKLLV